jgi:hypothetical protein
VAYNLFEFVNAAGKFPFRAWRQDLDKTQAARLQVKLDLLRTSGPDLSPGLLAGTSSGQIKKLRVQGNVKLRPRLCYGPILNDLEFSLLLGVFERDDKSVPANADDIAVDLRLQIIADPQNRRQPYVK